MSVAKQFQEFCDNENHSQGAKDFEAQALSSDLNKIPGLSGDAFPKLLAAKKVKSANQVMYWAPDYMTCEYVILRLPSPCSFGVGAFVRFFAKRVVVCGILSM